MENEFIFCQKCGERNSKANSICQKCAVSLTEPFQQPQQAQPQYVQPVQPQYIPPYQAQNPPPKKKGKGCLIALLIGVGLVILIGLIGAIGGGDTEKKTTEPNDSSFTTTQVTKVPIVVTVDNLVDALNENALKASNTYKGKYVELTGKLSTIDSSGNYFSLGVLHDEFSFDTVLCNIKKEHLNTVENFKSGQEVTVIGTITDVGEIMGYSLDIESIK
ncbi:MAG: hypothetical protein WCN92_06905 [Eubacteriales bacterium]